MSAAALFFERNLMIKNYTLNDGIKIPEIGFGTYKIPLNKLDTSVKFAYDCGYRLFDTAKVYGNEEQLGEVLKDFPRDSIFLTDKLWITDMGENIRRAFDKSLKYLKTDYLDLYLIHWPQNDKLTPDFEKINLQTWEEMIKLRESGLVRSIGVSNFTPKYLEPLFKTGVIPSIDQIEYHPGYLQKQTYSFCKDNGIILEAWSPLARQRVADSTLLESLSKKYGVSTSQIILRFIIQTGVIPIPKATSEAHIRENIDVFSFELSSKEVEEIWNLPECGYSGLHPDTFDKF